MPSTLPSLVKHQVRLAARPVSLPTPADWQFTGGPVAEPADGGVAVQVQALLMDDYKAPAPKAGHPQKRDRTLPAGDHRDGRLLEGGRMKSQEGVVEAGVAAFPDPLNKLFSGENFGKLMLRLV